MKSYPLLTVLVAALPLLSACDDKKNSNAVNPNDGGEMSREAAEADRLAQRAADADQKEIEAAAYDRHRNNSGHPGGGGRSHAY